MDACFELYVPVVAHLASLKPSPNNTFFWEGMEHPQTPVRYSWGEHVHVTETTIPPLVMDHLVGKVDEEGWTGLLVEGKALDLLALEVNGRDVDWEGEATLESFIRAQLAPHASWAVAFLPGCEQLDEISEGDIDRVVSSLRASLDWSLKTRGFIIWHG